MIITIITTITPNDNNNNNDTINNDILEPRLGDIAKGGLAKVQQSFNTYLAFCTFAKPPFAMSPKRGPRISLLVVSLSLLFVYYYYYYYVLLFLLVLLVLLV